MSNRTPRGTIYVVLNESRGKSFSVKEVTEKALQRDRVYSRYSSSPDLSMVVKGYKAAARSVLQQTKVQYTEPQTGKRFDERQWISYSTDGSKRNARWIDAESASFDQVKAHGALRNLNAAQAAAENKNWKDNIVDPLSSAALPTSWKLSDSYTIG